MDGEKHSGNLTDTSATPDVFNSAGYVLTDNDLIVDIDDGGKELIKEMIKLFDIRTETVWTTRGAHLYFKKPQGFRRAIGICPLGIKIEYKHVKNTKAITVKLDGVLRPRDNPGVRESLPWFLEVGKNYKELLGMSDGEGRNNALYSLKRQITGKDGMNSILTLVNSFVFAEPLNSKEMEQLLRAEVVPVGEKDNEYAVAEYLMSDLDFLGYGGHFYFKERGETEYISDEDVLNRIIYKMCPGMSTRYIDEVRKQMEYRCKKIPNDTVFKIKFKNGYLKDGEFVPIRIDEFTPYNIPIEYDPDLEPVQVVDDYIDHLTNSDAEYRKLLLEALAHTLVVDPEFKRMIAKFFIFIGGGGNGKGTLLQIIKGILGVENVTGMDIDELADERYLTSLKGKLANLGDDIQDSAIKERHMKILKNITSCDYIGTRELYKQAESMYFTATLIFTSNHLIKSFEKGKSYKRRVVWMPMYTEVQEGKKDPLFITKLTCEESVKYWIKLMIEGYQRLYKNHGFTESSLVNLFNTQYHEENNPYLMYVADFEPEDFIDKPVAEVYKDCEEWCQENAIEFKQPMFRETLTEVLGIRPDGQRKINGRNTKVFKAVTR